MASNCATRTHCCSTTSPSDVPQLTVILAHPSVPWRAEAISMATHQANVYIDLSGWRPRYFPAELVSAAGRQLRDKVLFGSEYPLITPERWMADADELDWEPEVRPAIYKHTPRPGCSDWPDLRRLCAGLRPASATL